MAKVISAECNFDIMAVGKRTDDQINPGYLMTRDFPKHCVLICLDAVNNWNFSALF
jgi:hypothetical protein